MMMRQQGSARLIPVRVAALARERCYALAAQWREFAKTIRRWELGQWLLRGFARRRLASLRTLQLEVWQELVVRFEPMFRDVLVASGCVQERMKAELTICFVKLRDILETNPQNTCMPEMMWQAGAMGRSVPADVSGQLRARFHLRALLDELPESDARAALRFFVFSTGAESTARRTSGVPVDNVYDIGRKQAVALGLEQFAGYLYQSRNQLHLLTAGAINAGHCESVAAAHQFICTNLLDD